MNYLVIYSEGSSELLHKGFGSLGAAQKYAVECDNGKDVFYGIYNRLEGGFATDHRGEPSEFDKQVMGMYLDLHLDLINVRDYSEEWRIAKWKIIKSYTAYTLLIIAVAIVTVICNRYSPYKLVPPVGPILAALFYSSSTLGYLVTFSVQTFSGKTPPEKLNNSLLIAGYILGTIFTILSL